jgi:hypothetical protein
MDMAVLSVRVGFMGEKSHSDTPGPPVAGSRATGARTDRVATTDPGGHRARHDDRPSFVLDFRH